jgi:hypothetical protein
MVQRRAAQALARSFDQHLLRLSANSREFIAGSTVETHRFTDMGSSV